MQSTKNTSARQVEKFRDHARVVVEHHFGTKPARLKYLAGGLSNFVFDVAHPEGNFIVRISPDPGRLKVFIKEHWTEAAARKAGIPTAEILETGDAIIPFPYVIARNVEGIDGTEHPEREKVLHELGRLASKINKVRTKGFGETFDWSNNELSRNKTFKQYLEDEYRWEDRLARLERSRLCPASTIKTIKQTFNQMLKMRASAVLNHGDLRLKNVIADEDGRIRAIIDWEKSTSNVAPHWELSVALHDLGIDECQHFVEGYGLKPKRLSEIAPFIKAFNLLNYVDEINRTVDEKDKVGLDRLKTRFAGVFDLYSI